MKNQSFENEEEQIQFGSLKDSFKLLELPDDLETYIRENPFTSLYFKGRERVVLCTDDKTYEVVKVKYSNTLLIKKIRSGIVEGIADHYFELTEVGDGKIINELMVLMQHNFFSKKESSFENDNMLIDNNGDSRKVRKKEKITMEFLENNCFACGNQILRCLGKISSFQVDGEWFLIDPRDRIEIMGLIVLALIEKGLTLNDGINEKIIFQEIDQYSIHSIKCCINELSLENKNGIHKFSGEKLARAVAEKILQSSSEWSINSFMSRWEKEIGDLVSVKEEMLYGVAIIKGQSRNTVKRYLERDLPLDLIERFQKLFSVKQIWSLKEICPYIEKYVDPNEKIEKFLMKYTRSTRGLGAKKFYVQK